MTWAFLYTIAILLGGGSILLLAGRWLKARWSALLSLLVAAGALLPPLLLRSGPTFVRLFTWIPALDWPIPVVYHADTLVQAFALLAALPALLLLLWTGLGAPTEEGHFSPWVLILLGIFLHLLCSADLLVTYAGWELLLLATYFLLTYRRAALPTPGIAEWFLGTQHLAGYPFLFALLSIGQQLGTLQHDRLHVGAVTPLALVLLLGTAWVRTAQVPFQGWALAAAETPGPVSTLLLGGWSLLAGPYLWLRLLAGAPGQGPHEVALIAGSVSLVVGAALALRQESGRQVQAGDTVSRLGLVWMALGLGGLLGVAAGLFLLLDLLLNKIVLHLALSNRKGLAHPVRRLLFAWGAWQALGLPPALGFVGRWLLVLGLIQAGRSIYLLVVLLSTPLALAYLWRGWTLVPPGTPATFRLDRISQRVVAVGVALVPFGGLAAPWLWGLVLERASTYILGAPADAPGALLGALQGWMPLWAVLALLVVGLGVWWSGAWRWRSSVPAGEDGAEGLLRESLSVLPKEATWLAWIGRPAAFYRFFAYLAGYIVTLIHNLVTFLERHTTYFVLLVLAAATIVLIVLTR